MADTPKGDFPGVPRMAAPRIETYKINVRCGNCNHIPLTNTGDVLHQKSRKFRVSKGMPVQKFLQEMTCENCRCEGYMGLL